MLRPNWWFQQNHAEKVGDIIRLQMSEMNISGNAKILSFNPCTIDTRCLNFTTEKGPNYVYRPITGYFERTVPEVWDYAFSSGDTIGATANHPFFSQDRQEYIPVGDLSIGERVKLAGEKDAFLSAKTKRENGAEKVYNLEIWREHNFHVGKEAVLVHNDCFTWMWNTLRNYQGVVETCLQHIKRGHLHGGAIPRKSYFGTHINEQKLEDMLTAAMQDYTDNAANAFFKENRYGPGLHHILVDMSPHPQFLSTTGHIGKYANGAGTVIQDVKRILITIDDNYNMINAFPTNLTTL
jgi:hypothetical protein